MRKIILILVFTIGVLSLHAQCNLPYKPLSAFGTDTTAFIIYNFMDRKDCYRGKTIKEVVKDLGMPVKYYRTRHAYRTYVYTGIYLYINDENTISYLRDNKKDDNAIFVYWENPVNAADSLFREFEIADIDWDKNAYDYLKDMEIRGVRVDFRSYSKYYDIYESKKRKLSENCGDKPYKPFSCFGTDTIDFVIYNFMYRRGCYAGKTIKDVVQDLGMPIKYYGGIFSLDEMFFRGIAINVREKFTQGGLKDYDNATFKIRILWEEPVNVKDSVFNEFRWSYPAWDEGGYDYLKNFCIKEVYVDIPRYSKYREEYSGWRIALEEEKYLEKGGRIYIKRDQW